MSPIKVRGVICNLHGEMNAASQLQPCNFQKRRSHLRSKHSILVSLYDCSCPLMYFSAPLSFAQQNRTYCSVVRHLVVRSKTVPNPCYSLGVEKNTKASVFLPPCPRLCLLYVMHKECGVCSPFKDKRLSWQQHLKCHVSVCLHSDESASQIQMEKNSLRDLWTVAAALNALCAQAHCQDRRFLNTAGPWQSDAESARDDRNILTLCHSARRWNKT